MASPKKFMLRSIEGGRIKVDEAPLEYCPTIKHLVENDGGYIAIPGNILVMVIEYCKKHLVAEKAKAKAASSFSGSADEKLYDEELKQWDADFVKVDDVTLFKLVLSANYLNMENLLDLACVHALDILQDKDKDFEHIRQALRRDNVRISKK